MKNTWRKKQEVLPIGTFETICNTNKKIIENLKEGENVASIIYFEKKVKPLTFASHKEKEALRKKLLNTLRKNNVKEYVCVMDCKTAKQEDCCVRNYYSPEKKAMSVLFYEGNKIIKEETIEGRTNKGDNWDLWDVGIEQ